MATIVQADRSASDEPLLADARRLSEGLGELVRIVQFRDRDRACCYDLSVTQCYALGGLVDAGALTVNELAAHLYLDKSTASRVADGLVTKGYAYRSPDPDDGRVVNLVPTPEGRALSRQIQRDLTNEYAALLEDFDPDVRRAMMVLLHRLGRSFAARVEVSGGSCCVIK